MNDTFQGGCYCGDIRFEVSDIFDAGYCHCSICRRLSGAPAIVWASAPTHSFRLTQGSGLTVGVSFVRELGALFLFNLRLWSVRSL